MRDSNTFRHTRALVGVPVLCLLLLATGATGARAIELEGPLGGPVSTTPYVSLTSVPQGGTVQIAIEIDISHPWHINAHELEDEYMVPTEIVFAPPEGMEVEGVVYPVAIEKKLSFSDEPLQLYEGTVYIGAVVKVYPDFPLGKTALRGTLTYQACDNEKCLVPATASVLVPLTVSSRREAIDASHPEIFAKIDFTALTGGVDGGGSGSGLGGTVASRGLFIAFLLVFVGGLALNLTPCVYPIIPITVSYFGGQSSGGRGSTVARAILYLLGMATMYSTLGVIAALTGSILGSALQNPLVTGFIALVMVGLALSMFGLYEFRVPAALSGVAGTGKQGYVGAFLMGLSVGIVAAPCIGPFVLGLLTFIGERGDPVLGFAMFFTLSLGLGVPFVFLAIASGNISKLPRSGEWMEWVRKLFGVVLLAMAVFFLDPLLPDSAYYVLMGALLVVCGVIMGFVLKVASTSAFFKWFRRLVGVALPLVGLWFVFAPGHIFGIAPAIPWIAYDDGYLAEAKSKNLPVVIDFSAEWCIPCKEMDHETFNQPEVVQAAKKVMPLRADLTKSVSQEVVQLREKYRIRGVPTIVFIDRHGRERDDLRVVHFIEKDEFLDKLDSLLGAPGE
jgi:thiol:disulfide interchange protein DsbD